VVVEPGGTTTVVFAGGGGLELLMHPAKSPVAIMALSKAFIVDSCTSRSISYRSLDLDSLGGLAAGAYDASECPDVSYDARSAPVIQ
jgi:hypothetical protein